MEDLRADAKDMLTNEDEFAMPVTLTSLGEEPVTVTVGALAVKHYFFYDIDGTIKNAKNSRVTVHEDTLTDAEYPYRNSANNINMVGHIVTFTDTSGIEWSYKVATQIPNETLGFILLNLIDYASST